MSEIENLMVWLRLLWKAHGAACTVRFRADGVTEFDVLCQELPPGPVGYWFNGVALAEWRGGWKAVTEAPWVNQLEQLSENPAALAGYPAGVVPRMEGQWFKQRVWVQPGVSDREAAQMSQVRAVNNRVARAEKMLQELESRPLPSTMSHVSVRADPVEPNDAVNRRFLDRQVAEIHSLLEQANQPVPCDVDALEGKVQALEALAHEVQDLERLVRTTGARFVGPVFVPWSEGQTMQPNQAVPWGALRESLRQQNPGKVVIVD